METIIALFLLTFGVLIGARLLDAGLGHQKKTELRAKAIRLGEKRMAELRAWVAQGVGGSSNFNSTSWAAGVRETDPHFPGLKARLVEKAQTLYSPCSEFEKPHIATGEARALKESARLVKIVVEDPSRPQFKIELSSMICAPAKKLSKVSLSPLNEPLPRPFEVTNSIDSPATDSFAKFEARGFYADGSVIPDLFFDWYVIPLGGNGTVIPSRDGRTATFVNAVLVDPNSPPVSTGGAAALAVHGQYAGQGQPPQEWVPPPQTPNPYIDVALPVFQLK